MDCPKRFRPKVSDDVQGLIRHLVGPRILGGITLILNFLGVKELITPKVGRKVG